jgi:hypothetical protein
MLIALNSRRPGGGKPQAAQPAKEIADPENEDAIS